MEYKEIVAAFEKLGLATEEQRGRFTGFAPTVPGATTEEEIVFIRADTNSRPLEMKNARLEADRRRA
jgi:hypothetical protein